MPPHSVKCARESTSAVTRETNTPRFSFVCSAIDSSWMWANVSTRRSASAASLVVTSRRADMRPARYATTIVAKPTAQIVYTNAGRNPPSKPWSKISCTRIGVMRFATVTVTARIAVNPSPRAELR